MKLKTISVLAILIFSFIAIGQAQTVKAASSYDYKEGDISGAVMADLSNINYTDLGLTALSFNSISNRQYSMDRMLIRSAFSVRSAVQLMDSHDAHFNSLYEGVEVFTGVPGSYFSSATLDQYEGYFGEDFTTDNPNVKVGIGLNSYAGDTEGDVGSNETLLEHSYRADLNHKNFDTADYAALNKTEVENLNTQYADLTDDLLETDEEEDEFKEEANDIVVASFDNAEAAIQEVMRKRISQIINIPSSQIRIDNYTLTDAWHEQAMSDSLADTILDAYDEGKSAGFLSKFKVKSPFKFSKISLGQKWNTFKQRAGAVRSATVKTFDNIRGSTAITTALAFKDRVVKGSVSTFTGLKEKARTGFGKITSGLSKLKSGTLKLLSKPLAWFNGLATKAKKIIKIIIIIVVVLIVLWLAMKIYFVRSMRSKAGV